MQLETLNTEYIQFKNNSHNLSGKNKKFQNFIKKALDKLNEPYLIKTQSMKVNIETFTDSKLNEENKKSELFLNSFSGLKKNNIQSEIFFYKKKVFN